MERQLNVKTSPMNFLLKVLSVALVTQKTLTAVGASIVITVGVYEYLKNKRNN